MQSTPNQLHPDFIVAQKLIYQPAGLVCSHIAQEAESADYGAYTFQLGNQRILFRVAKITPTKIGQFVTVWKRIGNGPIMPYDLADPIDLFVISVRSGQHFGQFVFPKAVLHAHGVVSQAGNGGKRALRIYPPWGVPTSKQAQQSQVWQLTYFVAIDAQHGVDIMVIQKLYLQ
jgi:hypothetical protein